MENKIKEVDQNDPTLEEHWKKEYENWQDQWKRKAVADPNKNSPLAPKQHNFREKIMSDGTEFWQALTDQPILNTIISQQILATYTENNVDIDTIIKNLH